ncbi:MAG: YmfQ family protein [Oscillospiraceae bacterium]|jgi:hypothetical protein|nr:YmfQ family protein [Oscillospiraceae bacterium]
MRRLFDYLPPALRRARELRVLLDCAEQPETDGLWGAMELLWAEQFIGSATGDGLARWEGMMRLPPAGDIAARREAVLMRFRETPPFTASSLPDAMDALCGPGRYEMEKRGPFELWVRISKYAPLAEARALLRRWLPANILMDMDFLYLTQEKLRKYSHGELAAFTHTGIRDMTD